MVVTRSMPGACACDGAARLAMAAKATVASALSVREAEKEIIADSGGRLL
jgi:hypothetical protein